MEGERGGAERWCTMPLDDGKMVEGTPEVDGAMVVAEVMTKLSAVVSVKSIVSGR